MKIVERRRIVVIILGLFIFLMGLFSRANAKDIESYYLSISFIIQGMWIVFAAWSSYALAGKGYKPGLCIALAFFPFIGVVIAYLLPNKKDYYYRNRYTYLEQINNLTKEGVLTKEEYDIEKIKIMRQ